MKNCCLKNMFRSTLIAGAMLAFAGLFSACSTVSETAEATAEVDPVIAAESELSEKLLIAFMKDDVKEFRSHLTGAALEKFGEKEFRVTRQQITEAMGEVKDYEYLTTLYAPGFRSYVWKVTFERGQTRDQTKKLTQETLFRVVMVTPADEKVPPFIFTFGFL